MIGDVNYWIPSEFGYSGANRDAFKKTFATIIYNYIFDGCIIISDSILVNTFQLRTLIAKSELMRWLIKEKGILLATRESEKGFMPLVETADKIKNNNAINPSFIDKSRFEDYSELSFVEEHCTKVGYNISDAMKYYTTNILATFKGLDFGEELPNYVQKIIIEEADIEFKKKGFLGGAFFEREQNIGTILKERTKDNLIWSKYGGKIKNISLANYIAFLPDKYNANPVYGRDIAEAINIWRLRENVNIEEVESPIFFHSNLEPSTFIDGILELDIDDIVYLTNSDEFANYKQNLNQYGNSNVKSKEVISSFITYRKLVDSLILKKIGLLNKRKFKMRVLTNKLSKHLGTFGQVVDYLLFQVLDAYTLGGASMLRTGISIYTNVTKGESSIRQEIDDQNLINDIRQKLSQSSDSNSISSISQRKRIYSDGKRDTMISFV